MKVLRNIIITTVGILLSELAWYYYKSCRTYRSKSQCKRVDYQLDKESITEVLFFSQRSALCRDHLKSTILCTRPNCAVVNYRKLVNHIESAKQYLDVCMYFLTSQDLVKAVINAQRRGVIVRLILDATMAENGSSHAYAFRRANVGIKVRHFDVLMHHKFAIVDGRILITGSSNWTMTAFFGNFENVIITNQTVIVKCFADEFERLWTTLLDKP